MARIKFEKNREERIEEKKNHYAEKAEALKNESNSKCEEAINMAKCIPFGQPIHIGHHSEKADRKFRERIDNKMRSSVMLQDKSNYYLEKANTESNAIHSLDEKADEKLQAKISVLEKSIELMKNANKAIRKITNQDEFDSFIDDPTISAELIEAIKSQRDHTVRFYYQPKAFIYPFTYGLTNSGAELRRLKKRLEIIKLQDQRKEYYFKNELAELKEEESRFNIYFENVPNEEVRSRLKKLALKWSPSRKAWTRQITTSTNSKRLYDSIVEVLNTI